MRALGNILWFILGGFLVGLGLILGGIGLLITILGIPFGIQAIKLGVASFAPFGKEVVEREGADSSLRILFNVLWIVFFGWELAVAHLVLALLLAITILGIPFARQHLKLIPLSLLPFGRDLVAVEQAQS